MRLYLLTGTPGQSKGYAAEKIANWLREKGLKVGVGDVEQELASLKFTNFKPPPNKDPLVSLIGERAQDEIKRRWTEAYEKAIEKASAGDPDIVIIVACLEYYRYETYEFYSPINFAALQKTPPIAILTLIEDIYEIYYRLSQPGQVFDIQELVERTFPPSDRRPESKDLRRLYKDSLSVAIGSLLRVLVWREKEIACGANVAGMVGCGHSVLAVKHPVETGARLLLGSTSVDFDNVGPTYQVYVSHPISRSRRDRLSQGAWPIFVQNLEHVVTSLAADKVDGQQVLPIMPTAIDEYRLFDDGTYLHPFLTPRWPIQSGHELLYSQPSAPEPIRPFSGYEDYESRGIASIFDPPLDSTGRRVGLPLSDPEVSGVLRTLKESIRLQMAGRDHLLVRQCPGFFLYRPLYGEFEFSGGVTSEIHTFHGIREHVPLKAPRQLVFIHDLVDVQGLFKADKDGKYPDTVRQAQSAVYNTAYKYLKGNTTKTKNPKHPSEEKVAVALQCPGDLVDVTRKIHDEMFQSGAEGSIGAELPVIWEQTGDHLVKAVEREQIKALCSDIANKMVYSYSKEKVLATRTAEKDDPADKSPDSADTLPIDTYVDVVEGLDSSGERRKNAATRATNFFAQDGAVVKAKAASEKGS
jgi:hypothetical protein